MKLIELLVKELPNRGGWPEVALNATQDKDGEVCFSSGATPEFGYAAWEGGDWCGNEFHTIRADSDTRLSAWPTSLCASARFARFVSTFVSRSSTVDMFILFGICTPHFFTTGYTPVFK
jgi:hypothetical protein